MSHIQPSNPVDSQGGDCTDPDTHSVRVSIIGDGGGGGGGGAITIADGADVALGSTTDPAVVTDAPGTVISFLRGLVTILSSVWDVSIGRLFVGLLDSAGGECTDPATHTVRVSVIGDSGGGGGGGGVTEVTSSHAFTTNGEEFVLDVGPYAVVCLMWGDGTSGGNDAYIAPYVSNDGGATYMSYPRVSTWPPDQGRSETWGYFSSNRRPGFLNVTGFDRVMFRSGGPSPGEVAVLSVRASSALPWLPTRPVVLANTDGAMATIDGGGRLEVSVPSPVEVRVSWHRPLSPGTVDLTTTSAVVAVKNNRTSLVVSNLSDTETVFLAFAENDAVIDAVLNSGIAVFPRSRWESRFFSVTSFIVYGIATGPATVAVQQFEF